MKSGLRFTETSLPGHFGKTNKFNFAKIDIQLSFLGLMHNLASAPCFLMKCQSIQPLTRASQVTSLNLFPVEIHLFFFDVIALQFDAHKPTVFKCHQPRTEKVRVLSIDPLLSCLHSFFIRPEMTSTDILFQVWE